MVTTAPELSGAPTDRGTQAITPSAQRWRHVAPFTPRRLHASDAELAGWSIAAVLIVLAGLNVWHSALDYPAELAATFVLVLGGLVLLATLWITRQATKWVTVTALGLAALACVATSVMGVRANPTYGTDELAFGQYAAQLLIHGVNPYTRSMAPALGLFHVPDIYRTYTLSGGAVSAISYPAGSFLFDVPSLLAGMHMQAAVVTDVAAWILGGVLAAVLLPRTLRWSVVPLLLAPVYVGLVIGGVTDVLYLPFLLVALWRWDRFADPDETSVARWIGPLALGLACTVKQTPWFVAPFLVLGVAVEARARGAGVLRTVARYGGMAIAVFAVVNLPFALGAPRAFAHDMVLPLVAATEPGGQGLIGLTMFDHLGGRLVFYTVAAGLVLGGVLTAFLGWYASLKRAWLVLVALVFFWPSRSFGSYLIMLLPAVLVAATTVRNSRWRGSRTARRLAFGCAAGGLAAIGAALLLPPALRLQILSERSTGELQTVDELTVRVTNTAAVAITPHYAITPIGQPSNFWRVTRGPTRLAPHTAATVVLAARDMQSMPSITGGFVLDAYSASPAELATAPTVKIGQRSTVLSPEDVPRTVSVGRPVHMNVALVDRFGNPIHDKGVRVDLAQVVYTESGLSFGEASINGSAEGATPVSVRTGPRGVAHFTVVGVQAPLRPTFFQAWVVSNHRPPSAYSNIVSVQFVARR